MNKVLLENSHIYLWLILLSNDRVVMAVTTWPTKTKIFTIWTFMEKVH